MHFAVVPPYWISRKINLCGGIETRVDHVGGFSQTLNIGYWAAETELGASPGKRCFRRA